MSTRVALRTALGFLVVSALVVGVWAAVDPRSFYRDFPGFGHAWVASDGPFNEHLLRDVGELNLALALVTAVAAAALTRPLALAASGAWLAYSLPHLAYHALNLGRAGGTGDQVGELVALAIPIVLATVVLLLAARRDGAGATPSRAVGASRASGGASP